MSRLFVYLGRFAVIVLGFFCAALAASAFIHVLVFAGAGLFEREVRDPSVAAMFVSVPVVAAFVGYAAFAPAFIFFLVCEFAGWRSWPVHALGGAAVAAVALFARYGAFAGEPPSGDRLDLLMIATGMVGGIAYWAVAGRSAGRWLHRDLPGGRGEDPQREG